MKKISITLVILLLIILGCGEKKQENQSDGIITVDVTASYPKKELILQDFMDVEYIPLETNDEFVCHGFLQGVSEDLIVIRDPNHVEDGNIFIFDRNGKALKKINRKGQGPEEYTHFLGVTIDKDNDELFVNDAAGKKIVVYDLEGNFKRSFSHIENASYHHVYNFDRENLICYDQRDVNKQSFIIVSKEDGSITKEIQIPYYGKKISTWLISHDEKNNITYSINPQYEHPITPALESWILMDSSSDTIYRYLPNHDMIPIIARTPSVRSMNPEVFLFPGIITDRYYFMLSVKKEFDFSTGRGHPSTNLLYDEQENAIFEYTLYNGDYSNKKQIYTRNIPINNEIAIWQYLEAPDLIEAYENGELKGKLREIAATLDEESNPVIMLVKERKK